MVFRRIHEPAQVVQGQSGTDRQAACEHSPTGGARRRAFTLIEIMVVLTILAALMAMGFGGFRHVREKANRDATQAMVEAVANGIAARGPEITIIRRFTVNQVLSWPIWDCDRDGLVDGQGLDLKDVALTTPLREAGYAGLTPDVAEVPAHFRNVEGQPIDAWGMPLRYAYAPNRRMAAGYVRETGYLPAMYRQGAAVRADLAQRLGAKGFVVWSTGPDMTDNTPDDIFAAP